VADESPSRRDFLTIKAYDPAMKGEIDVYLSHERLLAIGRRSRGQILEAAEVVPQILQCRGPVFEGFRISEETGEIIGSLLKRVTPLCEKLLQTLPGFQIEIRHKRVKLVHIFRAKLWSSQFSPDDLTTLTYEKLIDVAQQTGVEVDLPKAA
jgi:hypothetical protein